MAVDAIKIYTNGLNKKINSETNKRTIDEIITFTSSYFKWYPGSDWRGASYNLDIEDKGIYVRYFPKYHNGELTIQFNIPRLMAGTNVCSMFCFNIEELSQKLSYALWPYVNIHNAPLLRFWFVSRVEINIDIIDEKRKIDALYDVLKRTASTNKFKQQHAYSTGGKTLYFIPSNAKFESSDIVLKIYYKLNQMKECNKGFNILDLYNNKQIINLNTTQDILRVEIIKHRGHIYKDFKTKIIGQDSSLRLLDTNRFSIENSRVGTLEQVLNFDYQCKIINGTLSELNLNKKVLTASKLKTVINNHDAISSKKKQLFWNAIEHENKISHKKKPRPSDRQECLRYISDLGYNYRYSYIELEAITLDSILRNLPEIQLKEIEIYKRSNLYKDLLFFKSTPPRNISKRYGL